MNAKSTVIFLHNYKAGGTTLRKIIARQYPPASIYTVPSTPANVGEIKRPDLLVGPDIRLIQGHIPFGLHELLPSPATYMTMLRDPIDRVVSLYYFVRAKPHHKWHDRVVGNDLERFVTTGQLPEVDNGQTRRLSGQDPPFGQCSRAMLERAKRNLQEHFAVVGTTERFDETLLLMRRTFGWRSILYFKSKVNRDRPREGLSKESLAALRPYTELDVELHHFAERQLEEAIARQPRAFHRDIEAFSTLNERLTPMDGPADPLGETVAASDGDAGRELSGAELRMLVREFTHMLRQHDLQDEAIRELHDRLRREQERAEWERSAIRTSRLWHLRNQVRAYQARITAALGLRDRRNDGTRVAATPSDGRMPAVRPSRAARLKTRHHL